MDPNSENLTHNPNNLTSAAMEETLSEVSKEGDLLLKERSDHEARVYESSDSIRAAFARINERICEEHLSPEEKSIGEMVLEVEAKVVEYVEKRNKEKKELENSIVSLTEENRDVNSLLRIALAEKEAIEKRVKGSGEQKKVGAILQIAERGLQKVGFGFMMGAAAAVAGESQLDQPSTSSGSTKSDGSECEEEVISLAATVEKIMRSLRLQISDLRGALDESRLDNEHLQILADKQANKITETTLRITNLEEREKMLALNVEELMADITEAREEVARWREACELEVEAGKVAIEEREKEVAMLQQDLEGTKAALEAASNKLLMKERLAATAMAAQAAAEASLQLADSRSSELRDRIEELTRQVEEEADHSKKEQRKSSRKRVRHVCWPWRALKLTPNWQGTGDGGGASWVRGRNKKMLPDTEGLLHHM